MPRTGGQSPCLTNAVCWSIGYEFSTQPADVSCRLLRHYTVLHEDYTKAEFILLICTELLRIASVAKYKILRVLGKLAKLRQATVSFFAPVCPSAWDKSSPTGQIAMQLDMSIFRKQVEKIQISLKSVKNNGYFTRRPTYIYGNIWLNASQNEKCFRQKLCIVSKHTFYGQSFF